MIFARRSVESIAHSELGRSMRALFDGKGDG